MLKMSTMLPPVNSKLKGRIALYASVAALAFGASLFESNPTPSSPLTDGLDKKTGLTAKQQKMVEQIKKNAKPNASFFEDKKNPSAETATVESPEAKRMKQHAQSMNDSTALTAKQKTKPTDWLWLAPAFLSVISFGKKRLTGRSLTDHVYGARSDNEAAYNQKVFDEATEKLDLSPVRRAIHKKTGILLEKNARKKFNEAASPKEIPYSWLPRFRRDRTEVIGSEILAKPGTTRGAMMGKERHTI